jgi:hypothetical protein
MTIPPTKAQIDAALGAPAAANTLLDDIRKTVTDPSVIYPEMFGAPEVSRDNLPAHDPSTTVASDTTACVAALANLRDRGGTLLLRRKYGINAGLTLEGTRESTKDGLRIAGTGPYTTGFHMTANGFNCLLIRGLDPSSGRRPFHCSVENLGITGGSGTGKGIFVQGGSSTHTDISNGYFGRLYINTGDTGIHLSKCFQLTLHLIKAGSAKGHAFSLQGGNTTHLLGCYAMAAGDGFAGYRIIAGSPVTMLACTGVDEPGCSWAALGSMANVAGTTRSGSTTSMVKLGTAHTEPTGFFDMCQIKITSGALDGAEVRISRYVGGADPTAYLSTHTPLASSPASGVTYNISDGDSQFSQAGTPYAKDPRITIQDCNLESFSRTGIKTYRAGLLTIQNALFFLDPSVSPTHDCCVYLNEAITNYTVKMVASRFDLTPRNAGYPAEFIQGKGDKPMMMVERVDSSPSYRTIHSMETGTALRMRHDDPYDITLPTGFPTSNPGAGRLWSNGGILTVGT